MSQIKYFNQEQSELVTLLENMLDSAKAGEMTSIAITAGYSDGRIGSSYSLDCDLPTMIGAIEILKTELTCMAFEAMSSSA